MAKGRNTQSLFDVLDAQGDMTHREAETHLKKVGKDVHEYFYGSHGKGTNRFNSFKNQWKHERNEPIGGKKKSRKSKKDETPTRRRRRPAGTTTATTTTRRRRTTGSDDVVTALNRVEKMGGLSAVKAQIAELQGLVETVETVQAKIKSVA